MEKYFKNLGVFFSENEKKEKKREFGGWFLWIYFFPFLEIKIKIKLASSRPRHFLDHHLL
jgi:hypothetical protein